MGQFLNKLDKQKTFLKKGLFSVKERIRLLNELLFKIKEHKKDIYDAFKKDFNKSKQEVDLIELNPVLSELNYFLKNIKTLSKSQRICNNFKDYFRSKSYIKSQAYGSVLLMVSHDLPFCLSMMVIVGLIASGNTIFLKLPSGCENVNKIIRKILGSVFDDHHIYFVDNNSNEEEWKKELSDQNFDMVFFFGRSKNAKNIVKNYTSKFIKTVYQISSKCPLIIDETANIHLAAKRLVWAKSINSGQMSFVPDYILIHESVYNDFVQNFKKNYNELFGENYYKKMTKIITEENFNRLTNIIDKNKSKIVFGGNYDKDSRIIEQTLIDVVDLKSELMNGEIFGPILPIIKYNNPSDVFGIIDHNPDPLAVYVFSKNKKFLYEVQENIPTKILIFNDVMNQMFYNIPLGGIRSSGNLPFGNKYSWDLFTYKRVFIKSSKLSWRRRYQLTSDEQETNQ